MSADVGSVSTPLTSQDVVNAGVASGGGWFGGVGKLASAVLPTSALGNVSLVAVGVVLAVGALLISQKETTIQIATRVGEHLA